MSFTVRIKEEISHIENTKPEMIAELSGFVRNNATFIDGSLSLTTENTDTSERIKLFIKTLYNVDVDITVIDNLNFSNWTKDEKLLLLLCKMKASVFIYLLYYIKMHVNMFK